MKVSATLAVNGVAYAVELEPGTSLLYAVRDAVGLTGSKEGCDDSECGACMMLLDGEPVNSCSYLALQAQGRTIVTVEGLADRVRICRNRLPGLNGRSSRAGLARSTMLTS